jgi:hypothetical protein
MTASSHIRKAALIAGAGCAAFGIWTSAATAAADQRDRGTSKALSATGGVTIVPAGLAGAPLLTEWWRRPLSLPGDDPANPFNSGGCPSAAPGLVLTYPGGRCEVRTGTTFFVVGFTNSCSNIEDEPFHADTPLEAALCGLRNDRLTTIVRLTVDHNAPFSFLGGRFDSFMLPGRVIVPDNGISGGTPGEIQRFGGHGFVGFMHLPTGCHTLNWHIESRAEGFPPEGLNLAATVEVATRPDGDVDC